MTATASASRETRVPTGSNGSPIASVLRLVPARPDRDVQPPAGQDVERGEVLGEQRRVAQVVVVDEGADPKAVRRGGHGREVRDRRELSERDDRRTNVVTPRSLRRPGALSQIVDGRRVEGIGEEPERFHALSVAVRPRPGPGCLPALRWVG